jgi:hypothetical protein
MAIDHNPQAEQKVNESMERNPAFQARAIWPQEQPLFDRYHLPGPFDILDLGCDTGEITRRLAARYPAARHRRRHPDGNFAIARRSRRCARGFRRDDRRHRDPPQYAAWHVPVIPEDLRALVDTARFCRSTDRCEAPRFDLGAASRLAPLPRNAVAPRIHPRWQTSTAQRCRMRPASPAEIQPCRT